MAWLKGAVYRDRSFRSAQGIRIPIDPPRADGSPGLSWTDLLDAEPTRPSYQLLHHWTRCFQRRAGRLLGSLVPAADWCAIELQTLADLLETEDFSGFRASPLVLAAGLYSLLPLPVRADPSVDVSLSDLVRVLSAHRLPLSHQVLRASSGHIRYDTLVL